MALKKTKVKLDFLTVINMLLMIKKGIKGRIYHAFHWYAKVNNKHMKNYVDNKESSYLKNWKVNNLYGWAMSQKLPVDGFNWVENISQFNKDFLDSYNEDSNERYFQVIENIFLKLVFNILKNNMSFTLINLFCLKEEDLKD